MGNKSPEGGYHQQKWSVHGDVGFSNIKVEELRFKHHNTSHFASKKVRRWTTKVAQVFYEVRGPRIEGDGDKCLIVFSRKTMRFWYLKWDFQLTSSPMLGLFYSDPNSFGTLKPLTPRSCLAKGGGWCTLEQRCVEDDTAYCPSEPRMHGFASGKSQSKMDLQVHPF